MSSQARILVIDDDPLFRSLIASLLRREYAVAVAGDGAEGFYKALESPPDVAIVDVQMPGWDGLKTLKAFRAHPALAAVRTMILSADASKGTVLTAIDSGADDYLIKTHFSKEYLFEKLHRVLPASASPSSRPSEPRLAPPPATQASHGTAVPAEPQMADALAEIEPVDQARLQEILDEWE